MLFTGDFGNENVELVKSVSELDIPKAAILGNHDAWNTREFSTEKKDAVGLQLELLGEQHVAYRHMDIPLLGVSVVGCRPFSNGGDRLFRPKLLSSRYGVDEMKASADRICKAALEASKSSNAVILLAHNGPAGLGSRINDICGRDWVDGGGDHGDPDLAQALSQMKNKNSDSRVCVSLVVFGHMHNVLANRGGMRKMVSVGKDETIYLNGAIVPRVIKYCRSEPVRAKTGGSNRSDGSTDNNVNGTLRAFTMVEIQDKTIIRITETWVLVAASKLEIARETILYEL